MSIHTLFKTLLNTHTNNNTVSKSSSAEIAFDFWQKERTLKTEGESYLKSLYNEEHEKHRAEKQLLSDDYAAIKEELMDQFYKTRSTKYLNQISTHSMPEELFIKDTRIYTMYNIPSSSILYNHIIYYNQ